MQRQAVPLLKPESPIVESGNEAFVADQTVTKKQIQFKIIKNGST